MGWEEGSVGWGAVGREGRREGHWREGWREGGKGQEREGGKRALDALRWCFSLPADPSVDSQYCLLPRLWHHLRQDVACVLRLLQLQQTQEEQENSELVK